jgi:hypothetical protein
MSSPPVRILDVIENDLIKQTKRYKEKLVDFLRENLNETSKCVFHDKVFDLLLDEVCDTIYNLQFSSNENEFDDFIRNIRNEM